MTVRRALAFLVLCACAEPAAPLGPKVHIAWSTMNPVGCRLWLSGLM